MINTDNRALHPALLTAVSPGVAFLCPHILPLSLLQEHGPSCSILVRDMLVLLRHTKDLHSSLHLVTALSPSDLSSGMLFLREAFPDFLDSVKCPL